MDADRRDRLTALLVSLGDNPLVGPCRELLAEVDSWAASSLASVTVERDQLKADLAALTAAHRTLISDHTLIQSQNEALTATTATALQKAADATRTAAELNTQLSSLRAAIDPLRADKTTLEADLAAARDTIRGLEEKVTVLKAETHTLHQTLDDLVPPRRTRQATP